MTYGSLCKCDAEELVSLYERCQLAYFGMHGFYYLRASTPSGDDMPKPVLAKYLSWLCGQRGWNNGVVLGPDGYGLAPMKIEFESLGELSMKLAARGY